MIYNSTEEQIELERRNSPATFTILNSINHEHKLTRNLVIQNGIKIDSLDNRMSGFEIRMDTLETDVAVLKSDVATLKTDVAVLKTDVAELKSDVGELKANVSQILSILLERKN